ncbi:MAG TPA: SPOR domain-containing protein [Acidobacteriaceae bacterium]|nr:SPOR domain-containing protein [Acidobacteriaceae bacterium]
MSILFEEVESTENELHFSPGAILAIFMGITLVSAVFFGLGYSFGRTGNTSQLQHTLLTFGHSSPAPTASAIPSPAPSAIQEPATIPNNAPIAVAAQTPPIQAQPAITQPVAALASATMAPEATSTAQAVSHSSYMVQIAAIVSRRDARALAAALQKDGLSAQVHSGSHDRFFHVQIGPFDSHQQAEDMRRKVIAAGYRAILKPA